MLWGTILALRQHFDQYVNLRPARALPGVPSPLRSVDGAGLDIVVVRENTEGEYSGIGGRLHHGDAELAVEVATFTHRGIERIVRYAFEYARERGRRLVTSATKSNALRHAMPFWDEVFAAVAADYPDIGHEDALVDALAARVITAPASLDVIVASNLHGDILSDITAAAAGSLGIGASANIDPTPRQPEPLPGRSRLGADDRRARHRQPARGDHVGRADARVPRRARRGRRDRPRRRAQRRRPGDADGGPWRQRRHA